MATIKKLIMMLILAMPADILAAEVFAYVDPQSDIVVKNPKIESADRAIASENEAEIEVPVEDPLAEWRESENEKFEAYLYKQNGDKEEARTAAARAKYSSRQNALVAEYSEEDQKEDRKPSAFRKVSQKQLSSNKSKKSSK